MEVRTDSGRVLLWKLRNFIVSKKQHFHVLGYHSTILRTAYRKQFYPNQWYCGKPRFWRSITRHLVNIGPWRVPKSGHMTITKNWKKIENLHIYDTHVEKFRLQKCYSFRSMTKNNKVIAEKPFPSNGVTIGACGRLAGLNWRSSSIYASSSVSAEPCRAGHEFFGQCTSLVSVSIWAILHASIANNTGYFCVVFDDNVRSVRPLRRR